MPLWTVTAAMTYDVEALTNEFRALLVAQKKSGPKVDQTMGQLRPIQTNRG